MGVAEETSLPAPLAGNDSATPQRRPWGIAAVLLWGTVVSCFQLQPLFSLPNGHFTLTHEQDTYPLRLLEFRDCLEAGYWFPQWCTHFRQGFGSPYFGYYQPGFFYAASVLPDSISLVHRVALTSLAFCLVGYLFTFLLVTRRFGTMAGVLAGTSLALAQYGLTNLYIRGDLSEFAAMNVVPAILYFLDGWLDAPNPRRFAGLAVTSGLLVVTHSCISLATFAFLALFLMTLVLKRRLRRQALLGLVALSFGAAIAAFYWMPVILEWHLIAVKEAFSGHFHFGNHFISPLHLAISRDSDHMPASLSLATWMLLATSLVSLAWKWREISAPQRQLLGMAASLCVFAMFLMSSASAPLWHHLPLLYRVQFPWRLLTLISVGVALLVGCLPEWGNKRYRIAVGVWLLVNLCVLSAIDSKREIRLMPFEEPSSPSDIEQSHFAPDVQDEWLPRGATLDRRITYARTVRPSAGVVAEEYVQSQGLLQCHVATDRTAHIVLPHLYFPGWVASLNGTPLDVAPDNDGFLRVALPANCTGMLEVRFTATPMRRLGIVVSALTFVIVLGIGLTPWQRWLTMLPPQQASRAPGPSQ